MPELHFGIYEQGIQTEAPFGQLRISGLDEFGFRPYFLLSSAVVGCGTGVFRRELAARGVAYEDLQVQADVTRNPAEANRIEDIRMRFTLKARGPAPTQDIQDAMDAMLRTSSMVQTVKASIRVTGSFTVVSE